MSLPYVPIPTNPLDVIPVPPNSVFCKACGTTHNLRGILCPAYRLDLCGLHKTVFVPHEKSIYQGSFLKDVDTECHRCMFGTSEKKLNRALTRANSLVLRPPVTHKDMVFCPYCWAPATKDCAHLTSCREHSTPFLRSQVDINARWYLRPSDFTCFLCAPNGVMLRKAQEWKKKLATAPPPRYFSSEWDDWKDLIKDQIAKLQPGRFVSWQARTDYMTWLNALGPNEMLFVRYLAYEGEYPVTSIYAETGTVPLSLLPPPPVILPSPGSIQPVPTVAVELPPPYTISGDNRGATCPPSDHCCRPPGCDQPEQPSARPACPPIGTELVMIPAPKATRVSQPQASAVSLDPRASHPVPDSPIPLLVPPQGGDVPPIRPPPRQTARPVPPSIAQPRFQTVHPTTAYRNPYDEAQPSMSRPEQSPPLPPLVHNATQSVQYLPPTHPVPPRFTQPQVQSAGSSRTAQNPLHNTHHNANVQQSISSLPPNPYRNLASQSQPAPLVPPPTPVPPPARRISFAPQHISRPSRPVIAPHVPPQPHTIPPGVTPQHISQSSHPVVNPPIPAQPHTISGALQPQPPAPEQPTITPAMARWLADLRAQRAPPNRTRNSTYSMPGAYPQGHPADDDWKTTTSMTQDDDDDTSSAISYNHRSPVVPYLNPDTNHQRPNLNRNPMSQVFQQAWAGTRQSGAIV